MVRVGVEEVSRDEPLSSVLSFVRSYHPLVMGSVLVIDISISWTNRVVQ